MQYQLNEFREYFIGNNQYKGVNSVLFGGIIGSFTLTLSFDIYFFFNLKKLSCIS